MQRVLIGLAVDSDCIQLAVTEQRQDCAPGSTAITPGQTGVVVYRASAAGFWPQPAPATPQEKLGSIVLA